MNSAVLRAEVVPQQTYVVMLASVTYRQLIFLCFTAAAGYWAQHHPCQQHTSDTPDNHAHCQQGS